MPACLSKFTDVECHVVGHTWDPSCSGSAIRVFINCMKYSWQLYTPLYTVTAFLNQRSRKYFMKKLFLEIAQSSMFLSCNGFFMIVFFCLIRKVLGGMYPLSAGFLPGLCCSFCAILIERKSRRGALAIYMLNQAFETIFNMLKHNGYAKDIPCGEVYLFAAAASALMYLYRSNNLPDGIVKTMIEKTDMRYITKKLSKRKSDIEHLKASCRLASKTFAMGYGLQGGYNLLMALPRMFKSPSKIFKALIKTDNFQMGAFFSSLVFIFNVTERILSNWNKDKPNQNAAMAGFLAGFSMLFQRNSYISIYTFSKTLELFYMNGIQKGIFPYVKNFDTMLYTVCTAIMFHAAVLQPTYLKPTYWNFLLKLTGQRFESIDRKYWDVFGYDSSLVPKTKNS